MVRQSLEQKPIVDQPLQRRTKRLRIERVVQESALAIEYQLRNTTDSRSDHWNAVHECLVDYERRILRPQRRNNEDIHAPIHVVHSLAIERTFEHNLWTSRRAERGEVRRKDVRIAVDVHFESTAKLASRLEKDVDALVPHQRAEEADAQRLITRADATNMFGASAEPVVRNVQAVPRESQTAKLVRHRLRWRDTQVDRFKHLSRDGKTLTDI